MFLWSGLTWTGRTRDLRVVQRADQLDVLRSARDLVSAGPAIVLQVHEASQVRGGAARDVGQVRHARQASQARQARLSSRTSTTARFIDDC